MENTKYNGWTNYATWRVNLELFDGSYDETHWTAESAREYVENLIIDTTNPGIAMDYAMAFLSDVNWHEIAEHHCQEEEETV